jgi:hypothetical protein
MFWPVLTFPESIFAGDHWQRCLSLPVNCSTLETEYTGLVHGYSCHSSQRWVVYQICEYQHFSKFAPHLVQHMRQQSGIASKSEETACCRDS